MTPSTRKPSVKQMQALHAIIRATTHDTAGIHAFRAKGLEAAGKPPEKQRSTYELLVACERYEWLERAVVDEAARSASPNDGSGYDWFATDAGREALERGHAALQQPKGDDVGTTTEAPPQQAPGWGGSSATPPPSDDVIGQAPIEDDPIEPQSPDPEDPPVEDDEPSTGEDVKVDDDEVEVEDAGTEKQEGVHVNEGSNQLSLAIGGPKPKSSILKIMAKQQKFGSTRQFKNMERIEFSGVLEVRGVAVDVQANGFVQRMQKAVIAELVIDGVDVTDGDD